MTSISIKQTAPGEASVILDGTEINRGLRGIEVAMQPNSLTRVTLDVLVIEDFHLDTKNAIVIIPEATADTLKALGWTAPEATA